jgi:hypothetical protein
LNEEIYTPSPYYLYDVEDDETYYTCYRVKIDESNILIDSEGCISLLEEIEDNWKFCKDWKLEISTGKLVLVDKTNENSSSKYWGVLNTIKFNGILIFWILKLKILAKRAVKRCKRYKIKVFERGVDQTRLEIDSQSILKTLTFQSVWFQLNMEKLVRDYLDVNESNLNERRIRDWKQLGIISDSSKKS